MDIHSTLVLLLLSQLLESPFLGSGFLPSPCLFISLFSIAGALALLESSLLWWSICVICFSSSRSTWAIFAKVVVVVNGAIGVIVICSFAGVALGGLRRSSRAS